MQKRAGSGDLEQAARLKQDERENASLAPPVVDWRKDSKPCLLTMVVTTDEAPEEIDVAGWPAIVPHLYG